MERVSDGVSEFVSLLQVFTNCKRSYLEKKARRLRIGISRRDCLAVLRPSFPLGSSATTPRSCSTLVCSSFSLSSTLVCSSFSLSSSPLVCSSCCFPSNTKANEGYYKVKRKHTLTCETVRPVSAARSSNRAANSFPVLRRPSDHTAFKLILCDSVYLVLFDIFSEYYWTRLVLLGNNFNRRTWKRMLDSNQWLQIWTVAVQPCNESNQPN